MTERQVDGSRDFTIGVVVSASLMWAFWWFPVGLLEAFGATGAWVSVLMSGAALALAALALPFGKGGISPRAVLGSLFIGIAVALYTISVSYTDFMRAVLIFYICPAWSTMIEFAFFGRRFTGRALASIACSFTGLVFISRGEISFDGVGAIGDWIALISGIMWSIGSALVFSSREAGLAKTLVATLIGSVGIGFALIAIFGPVMGQPPKFEALSLPVLGSLGFAGFYIATLLGSTIWGATRLEPAAMTYLLSVEMVAGVAVAALLLGEPFGWFEFFGTVFIVSAVLLELTRGRDLPSQPDMALSGEGDAP